MSLFVGAMMGAQLATSMLGGISEAASQREQAKAGRESAEKQAKLLGLQKGQLTQSFAERGKLATDIYGNRMQDMASQVGQNLTDVQQAASGATSRAGFGYSGTIEQQREKGVSREKLSYETGKRELTGQHKQSMLGMAMEEKNLMSQIDVNMASLEGQINQYKAQENERFMGIF